MNKIKEIRKLKNIKQGELARALNISQPYLHDIEQGNRKGSKRVIEGISKFLGVPVSELFEE